MPGRVAVRTVLAWFGLLFVVGCTRDLQPQLGELPGGFEGAGTAAPRIDGRVGTPGAPPPPQTSYGTPPTVAGVVAAPGAEPPGGYSLDFAETDIRDVAAQILGAMLRVNYTIDPSVHGTATFRTVTPLSRSQLLATFQMLLAEDNAALQQSDGLYRVVPSAAALGAAGSVVLPLHYVSAEESGEGVAAHCRQQRQTGRRPRTQRSRIERRTGGA